MEVQEILAFGKSLNAHFGSPASASVGLFSAANLRGIQDRLDS